MTRIRNRAEADIGACAEALRTVHQASGYPANWPADPALWLCPPGTLQAWVAATDDIPVAGHVILRQSPTGEGPAEMSRLFVVPAAKRLGVASMLIEAVMRSATARDLDLFLEVTDDLQPAQELYQNVGFHHVSTAPADWTKPDGRTAILHRYTWSRSHRRHQEIH